MRGRMRGPRHRAHFMRGAGCAFAMLLLLSAIGVTTLIRAAAHGHEWIGVLVPVAIVAAMFILFFSGIRRFGYPLGDIIAAADRVGEGDYSTRLIERGAPWLRSV